MPEPASSACTCALQAQDGPRGNRRARGREALTRRGTWGVLRVGYSPIASSTVRARIHARCASHVVSATAPDARRLAR